VSDIGEDAAFDRLRRDAVAYVSSLEPAGAPDLRAPGPKAE
jgi:hypothetical protein